MLPAQDSSCFLCVCLSVCRGVGRTALRALAILLTPIVQSGSHRSLIAAASSALVGLTCPAMANSAVSTRGVLAVLKLAGEEAGERACGHVRRER
eukprot:SAG22_NODE_878_length_6715_cov_9.368652_11_plen_95_part_00